jgi:hypothetical protein
MKRRPGTPPVSARPGTALGFHPAAGLRVFLTHSFALSGEYRCQFAEANMSRDVAGKHLDLTGSMITLGLIYRFQLTPGPALDRVAPPSSSPGRVTLAKVSHRKVPHPGATRYASRP